MSSESDGSHKRDGAKPFFFSAFFYDESQAIDTLETCRWPAGYVCPRCGSQTKIYDLNSRQIGLKKCGACGRTFNVKTLTIFEDSRIPLYKWFQLIYLVVFSPNHIGIVEISYAVGIAYKTSWRINRIIKDRIDIEVFSNNNNRDAAETNLSNTAALLPELLKDSVLKEGKQNINFVLRASEFSASIEIDDFKNIIRKLIEID